MKRITADRSDDSDDSDSSPTSSPTSSESDTEYRECSDGGGNESGSESGNESGGESDDATQEAGLARLREVALQKTDLLALALDVTHKQVGEFVQGALVFSATADFGYLSQHYGFRDRKVVMAKLGVHCNVSDATVEAVVQPVRNSDMSKRINFAQSTLIQLLPKGGALANLIMHPGPALEVIITAHALTAAGIQHEKQQADASEIFEVLFGGRSEYSDAASANVSMDSVMEGLKERVRQWVASAASLSDAAFFRRLILNVAELGKHMGVVRQVLGLSHIPLNVAYMDASYKKGDTKIVHASGQGCVRVQLAGYPVGEWADALGLDTRGTKLRTKGLSLLGVSDKEQVGVYAMSQKQFAIGDLTRAISAFEEACKGSMMCQALRKVGFSDSAPVYPPGTGEQVYIPSAKGWYMHVRNSRAPGVSIALYNAQNVWRLLSRPIRRAAMVTVTIFPGTVINDTGSTNVLAELSDIEMAKMVAIRVYHAASLAHKDQNSPVVKAARSEVHRAKKAFDVERKRARTAKWARLHE